MKFILIFILVVILLLLILSRLILNMLLGIRCDEDKNLYYKTSDDYDDLDREDVEFISNGNELRGSFYYTNKDFKDVVIFNHGYGAGHHSYLTEIHAIAKDGHLVFSYDNCGCAYSDGKAVRSFYEGVLNLKDALSFLKSSEYKDLPIKVAGHSWGGYVASSSLISGYEIEKVGLIAPLNDPASTICALIGSYVKLPTSLLLPFIKFWLVIMDSKEALKSSCDFISETDVPVYIMQGDKDQSVLIKGSVVSDPRIKNKENVILAVKQGRRHNPYQSLKSENYLNDTFALVNKLKISKKKEDKEALEKLYKEIDYDLMTEEDEVNMRELLDFLK